LLNLVLDYSMMDFFMDLYITTFPVRD